MLPRNRPLGWVLQHPPDETPTESASEEQSEHWELGRPEVWLVPPI
jgi:hypothetical protein